MLTIRIYYSLASATLAVTGRILPVENVPNKMKITKNAGLSKLKTQHILDFGPGFTLTPGQTISLTGNLANNITVDFDVTLSLAGGVTRNYGAVAAPIPGAYFGLVGYTGLTGFPILLSDTGTANNLSNLIFSNITVTDASGQHQCTSVRRWGKLRWPYWYPAST